MLFPPDAALVKQLGQKATERKGNQQDQPEMRDRISMEYTRRLGIFTPAASSFQSASFIRARVSLPINAGSELAIRSLFERSLNE